VGHPAKTKTRDQIEAQGVLSKSDISQYFGIGRRKLDRFRAAGLWPAPKAFIGDSPIWPWAQIWEGLAKVKEARDQARELRKKAAT
jgi:hypothetical protein